MTNNKSNDTHIFFLFYHLGLGGVQRKIVDIVNYIEKNNDQNRQIIPHVLLRRKESFNLHSELPKGFRYIHIETNKTGQLNPLQHILHLCDLIIRYNPKILVPFLHQSAMYCIILKYLFFWKKLKVIISQDNVLSLENLPRYTFHTYPNFLIGVLYRQADLVITQTRFSKRDLILNYGISRKKIVVIQNWVLPKKISYPKQKKYDLIYCGRFAPQKNIIRMLEVVLMIKDSLPKIKLLLVGDGSDKNKIVHFIEKYKLSNNVIIMKPTRRIREQLEKAKIFMLTSDFENHPIILLEAMYHRLVPILLRFPGVEEYIQNGHNGFIVNTTTHLKDKIIYTLKNRELLKHVGNNAKKTVLLNNNQSLIKTTLATIFHA